MRLSIFDAGWIKDLVPFRDITLLLLELQVLELSEVFLRLRGREVLVAALCEGCDHEVGAVRVVLRLRLLLYHHLLLLHLHLHLVLLIELREALIRH